MTDALAKLLIAKGIVTDEEFKANSEGGRLTVHRVLTDL